VRYVLGVWFAFALGLALMAGCSDENGEGGSGGTGGVVRDCTGWDLVGPSCMSGDVEGICMLGDCRVPDCSAVDDETFCWAPGEKAPFTGLCSGGDCLLECSVLEEGAACHRLLSLGGERGECVNDSCIPFCEKDEDCIDFDNCTTDTCSETGLCAFVPLQDGAPCYEGEGTCQSGECVIASP
jgi:hypothetical protein